MTRLDQSLWPAIALLAVTLAVFQFTGADLALQDRLYDFQEGRWLLPRDSKPLEFAFHRLPKYSIILLAVLLALSFWARERHLWRRLRVIPIPSGRRLAIVLLTLALTPALVSLGKIATRAHCPWA